MINWGENEIQQLLDVGRKVQSLLEDGDMKALFEKLRQSYITEWETADPRDLQKREEAYLKLRVFRDLIAQLRAVVDTARAAETVRIAKGGEA